MFTMPSSGTGSSPHSRVHLVNISQLRTSSSMLQSHVASWRQITIRRTREIHCGGTREPVCDTPSRAFNTMPIVRPKTDLKSKSNNMTRSNTPSVRACRCGLGSVSPLWLCVVCFTLSRNTSRSWSGVWDTVSRIQRDARLASSSVPGQACPVDGELCAAQCGFSRVAKRTACASHSPPRVVKLRDCENQKIDSTAVFKHGSQHPESSSRRFLSERTDAIRAQNAPRINHHVRALTVDARGWNCPTSTNRNCVTECARGRRQDSCDHETSTTQRSKEQRSD